MAEKDDEKFSLLVSSTLDNFGFKKEMVSLRSQSVAEYYGAATNCFSEFPPRGNFVPAGSSAEGVALAKSDGDVMIVLDDIVCVDKGTVNGHFTILEVDDTHTAPGYTKVIFKHRGAAVCVFDAFSPGFCSQYTSVKGYPYVSSAALLNGIYDAFKIHDTGYYGEITRNGPALTLEFKLRNQSFENDNVFAVYHCGHQHLSKWSSRDRLYNWPAEEHARDISEMEGYIVPIGDKQSENQNLEWRVCYTTAEMKLVSLLNNTQIKLYVLLKMLAQDLLKPVCKAITSYVVKNVVFWIAERTHPHRFHPWYLVDLLRTSTHKTLFREQSLPKLHDTRKKSDERFSVRSAEAKYSTLPFRVFR